MPRRLHIVGRGATAEKLAELAGQLGYDELRVSDELPKDVSPEDHLVIAEDNIAEGRALLLAAAEAEIFPAYLGYAAPHAEGWKALVRLAAGKVDKARLEAVSAPAGVDVGAESPAEVAIAVAAELVALRRGRRRPSDGLPLARSSSVGTGAQPRRIIGQRKRGAKGDGGGEGRN